MAIEVTRKELTAAELRAAAAKMKDSRAARRMLAIAFVLEGVDRTTATTTCGMDRQTNNLADLTKRLAQRCRHGVGCTPHGVCREVGVARRGLHLRMAKQLADHGQSLAGCDSGLCKGVAQVVDPDVLDPCAGADALPEGLEVAERLAGQDASDDPRIAVNPLGTLQVFDRRGTDMHDFLAGFGIGQAQDAFVEIDVVPFQRHDLAKAASGQDQQPCGEDGRLQLDALAFHFAQHLADSMQLGGT